MKLLAIETATLTASVALVNSDDGAVLAERDASVSTHSDVLIDLIDRVLADAGANVGDLGGVAVGAGPGSFTGLRIGLATAKGLCFAQDIPLWTVSSLAALALDAGPHADHIVVPVVDAKKQEVFVGAFRVGEDGAPQQVADERVMAPEAIAEYCADLDVSPVFLGTGVVAYPTAIQHVGPIIEGARTTPSARSVAHIALTVDEHSDLAAAAPSYVRLSEAELKWRTTIP